MVCGSGPIGKHVLIFPTEHNGGAAADVMDPTDALADTERGRFKFRFIGKKADRRLFYGALYPMLGAFRWMVEINPETQLARWRGGFPAVLELWNSVGAELMKATQNTSDELGRKPHAWPQPQPLG